MTDKELEDFIHHGETGFVGFAMMFGDGWAQQAIAIAKELRARLAQPEPEPVAWTTDIEFDYDTEVIPAYKKGKIGTNNIDIPLYTKQPQQTEQKPIAWRWKDVDDYETIMSVKPPHDEAEPLYTAPPQREWQGLTDEDLVDCETEFDVAFARAIEAKLKEKNSG